MVGQQCSSGRSNVPVEEALISRPSPPTLNQPLSISAPSLGLILILALDVTPSDFPSVRRLREDDRWEARP